MGHVQALILYRSLCLFRLENDCRSNLLVVLDFAPPSHPIPGDLKVVATLTYKQSSGNLLFLLSSWTGRKHRYDVGTGHSGDWVQYNSFCASRDDQKCREGLDRSKGRVDYRYDQDKV